MIKISRLADYAVVVLTALAEQGGGLMSAAAIAQKTLLPEPTVSKVLKFLARDGIIKSIRGANGGYKLACPAANINVAQIIQAVDGPVSLTACVDGSNEVCDYHAGCPVNGRWDDVNMAVQSALESVTLADMMGARSFPKRSKETEIHGCI